jgi:hypothetical protein
MQACSLACRNRPRLRQRPARSGQPVRQGVEQWKEGDGEGVGRGVSATGNGLRSGWCTRGKVSDACVWPAVCDQARSSRKFPRQALRGRTLGQVPDEEANKDLKEGEAPKTKTVPIVTQVVDPRTHKSLLSQWTAHKQSGRQGARFQSCTCHSISLPMPSLGPLIPPLPSSSFRAAADRSLFLPLEQEWQLQNTQKPLWMRPPSQVRLFSSFLSLFTRPRPVALFSCSVTLSPLSPSFSFFSSSVSMFLLPLLPIPSLLVVLSRRNSGACLHLCSPQP